MGFFSSFSVAAVAPPGDEEPPRDPEWFGPPRGVVPSPSPQRVALFRTDKAVMWLGHFDVYPTGVEFEIQLHLRGVDDEIEHVPWELHHRRGRRSGGELEDNLLRLGVAFADGQVWTNMGGHFGAWEEPPKGPLVMSRGGGGGGGHWQMREWLWPLPPEGDLTFYAEWPALGIGEVSGSIDATELRRRAAEAETLWP